MRRFCWDRCLLLVSLDDGEMKEVVVQLVLPARLDNVRWLLLSLGSVGMFADSCTEALAAAGCGMSLALLSLAGQVLSFFPCCTECLLPLWLWLRIFNHTCSTGCSCGLS